MQPLEPEKSAPAPLVADPPRLVESRAQGSKEESHGPWARQVLFLQESDEETRLNTFFEILLQRLDLPPAGMRTEDFSHWEKEHQEALSLLFAEPGLPEQCGPSGALTQAIRRLTASLVQSAMVATQLLNSEIEQAKGELARLKSARNWLACRFIAYLAFSVWFFALLTVCCGDLSGLKSVGQPPPYSPTSTVTVLTFKALAFEAGSLGTLFAALFLGLLWRRKQAALRARQRDLQDKRAKLEKETNALQLEAPRSPQLPLSEADPANQRLALDLIVTVCKWRAAVSMEYIKAFLAQELWVNDRFAERLKTLLFEIQQPFPLSCGADVNRLRDDQVTSAFRVLAFVIASTIAAKVDLGRSSTLAQLILSGTELQSPMPSSDVVLEILESEGVLLKGDQLSDDTSLRMTELLKTLGA